ncbi:probable serine/threonine-protein kinase DDB_G0282963 isoform X1 [Trichogramma pretiosum]|uniref:probable serine/threonine-protein kinase DDB_G0282963 isoform X1 n=1 Tax=Trichogramma pretiosum TaxID=7493 RepID=UPI0006C96F59|nr:probable serine/threonine-protein kinase DDB_G0282963 isoform X1 [Trichogramma pretiosum]
MQRPLRELGRLLGSSSGSASAASNNNNNNNTTDNTEVVATEAQRRSSSCEDSTTAPVVTPAGLPLLQVWPSDSPRAVADDDNDETSAFVYPEAAQQIQQQQQDDSGIDSIQRLAVATVTKLKASPTPTGVVSTTTCVVVNNCSSPSTTPGQSRRPSLLHPDHARIHGLHHHHHHHHGAGGHHHHHHHHHQPHHHHHHHHHDKNGRMSPDRGSILDGGEADPADRPPSPSSSTTSSLKSMPSSAVTSTHSNERRRSSRYSMFDALDLEYALLRAAARGSVGPYSLSESLHKLTFTQSLAFPALARGLATKQTVAAKNAKRSLQQQHGETGMNAFAKVVTALVLVLVSVLVFGVVYKFVRT